MSKKKTVIPLDGWNARERAIGVINRLDLSSPWEIEIRPHVEKRSYSQNDLFWLWLDTLAKYFSTPEKKFTKDDLYLIVVHKFLGYETVTVGTTTIKDQLKSTKSLDKEEFYYFMMLIDDWALGLGCMLPSPENSQYQKMKEANQ